MRIIIALCLVIGLLSGGLYLSWQKNDELTKQVSDLGDKIKEQEKTIGEIRADNDLKAKLVESSRQEKIGLLEEKGTLLEELKEIQSKGPTIVETVRVVEQVRYVDLGVVESKLDAQYNALYNSIGVKK